MIMRQVWAVLIMASVVMVGGGTASADENRFAVVTVNNTKDVTIHFSYRWGTGNWKELKNLRPGRVEWFAIPLDSTGRAPRFQIKINEAIGAAVPINRTFNLKWKASPTYGYLVWSPDGARVAEYDRNAHVYDAHTWKEILTVEGNPQAAGLKVVAWSPDSKRIAVAGQSIEVWDVALGQVVLHVAGERRRLNSIAWSPDGQRLISVGEDKLLRFWDTGTGEQVLTLALDCNHASWSPDGRRLATNGYHGVKLLDTSKHDFWAPSVAHLHNRWGGESTDWFYLAMAYWQLGDKEKARKWYDEAVLWTKQWFKTDPIYNPFKRAEEEIPPVRAEAEALLHIKNPQDERKLQ